MDGFTPREMVLRLRMAHELVAHHAYRLLAAAAAADLADCQRAFECQREALALEQGWRARLRQRYDAAVTA